MSIDSQDFACSVTLRDLAATGALGARIAAGLQVGDCVALKGDLGAGKTTLARAILRALAVTERVPSPTFTLVQSYETPRLTLYHYDLYRIRDPREIDELGLDEALQDGAALIEWPERGGDRIPARGVAYFSYGNRRTIAPCRHHRPRALGAHFFGNRTCPLIEPKPSMNSSPAPVGARQPSFRCQATPPRGVTSGCTIAAARRC